ncbi:MAG TPA: response regulator transcription factor, partial [Acidimicrobiales bacterium]|nr:response regulator transcription factor [Acidimicrobiales bacterium]
GGFSFPQGYSKVQRMGAIRVLVVDDHQAFAGAVATMVSAQPDMDCVGTAHSSAAARAEVERLRPDVAVVDVDLAGDNGIAVAAELREVRPRIQTIILTAHEEPAVACAAVRAGASAFVTKSGPAQDLVAAIRGSVRGESFIPPLLLTGVLRELTGPIGRQSPEERGLASLTPREAEVLGCMVAGLDRAATAEKLYMSVNTVRTHARKVLAKLGAHSSLEAAAIAARATWQPAIRDGRTSLGRRSDCA